MTVLVTGAAGHLGGNLARVLLSRGHEVRALVHRDMRAIDGLDVEVVRGDVRDMSSLRAACQGIDQVYHTAGYVSIQEDDWSLLQEINVLGVRNVVRACLGSDVTRLVHVSSIHALDTDLSQGCVDESCPLVSSAGRSQYRHSKAAGEREVLEGIAQGLDAVIVRPTAILGPYDYRLSHQGQMILFLAQGKLPALVNGGFDWVDARDVAEAMIRAGATASPSSQYNLSGRWASAKEVAQMVSAICGVRAPRLTCPTSLAYLVVPLYTVLSRLIGARPLFTAIALDALNGGRTVSHERATRELGYRPRPLRKTIEDSLHWYVENGYLVPALPGASTEVV